MTDTTLQELEEKFNASLLLHATALGKLQDNYDETLGSMQENYNESLDTLWMILASALVFFMHAGFSLLEAGSVREKATNGILAKNLLVVTAGFLCWYVVGYGLALGVDEAHPGSFAGSTGFFMANFWEERSKFREWFFQGAFCATGGTIVSGAMAERTRLKGFGIFTVSMTSLIYPCVVYWSWSGSGFLSYTDADGKDVSLVGPAYMDFAGSGVVHMVGGLAALVGAVVVGPRDGRYTNPKEFMELRVPFCAMGTLFLWFGWYGFNPGSTGSLHDVETAYSVGLVAVNTTLAPCVSGLLVFYLRASPTKLYDVGGFCNGILAGLVSITAGCASVAPWESLIIGFLGGLIYHGSSKLLAKLHVDDVVDAFPVHGACGCWGVLAVGFFGSPREGKGGNGWFHGGDQLSTQLIAVILIALWSSVLSLLTFLPLKFGGLLRLSEDLRDASVETAEHSMWKDASVETTEHSMWKVDPAPECQQTEADALERKAKETVPNVVILPEETVPNGVILPEETVPNGVILPEGPCKPEPTIEPGGFVPRFPRKWLQSACGTFACFFRW